MRDEEEIRRDERIRRNEAGKAEMQGCLKVVALIIIASVLVGVCALWITRDDEPYQPNGYRPAPAPVDYATVSPRQAPARGGGQPVEACKTVWEYILYVAEGYEIDGFTRGAALETAMLGVAAMHGLTQDQLADCVDVLDAAGYRVTELQPRNR